MITADFIQEQDTSIYKFWRLVTRSKKMSLGCGYTEFLFDKEMFKVFVKKHKTDSVFLLQRLVKWVNFILIDKE